MDTKLLEALKQELKDIFGSVYEYGGGYGYRYQHGVRVMIYCQKIAQFPRFKNEKINLEALLTAALFHDIGKIVAVDKDGLLVYGDYGDKSHEIGGSEIAPKYLKKYISDQKLIDLICLIIKEQDRNVANTRIESSIIKDADRLDHQGVTHIWCSVTYANYQKKNVEAFEEFWKSDEGQVKFESSLNRYNFPEVAQIARKRLAKLKEFTQLMFSEQVGEDIVVDDQ